MSHWDLRLHSLTSGFCCAKHTFENHSKISFSKVVCVVIAGTISYQCFVKNSGFNLITNIELFSC